METLPPIALEPPTLFELPEPFTVLSRERHVYDASRLKVKRPDIYRAIVELTKRGFGQLQIQDVLGCNHELIACVQDENTSAVSIGKEARSRQNKRIDSVAGELLLRQLNAPHAQFTIEPRDVAQIKKIAHTAAMELDGDDPLTAAARVAAAPQHAALNAFIRRERGMDSAGEKTAHEREATAPDDVMDVTVLPERPESSQALPQALPQPSNVEVPAQS